MSPSHRISQEEYERTTWWGAPRNDSILPSLWMDSSQHLHPVVLSLRWRCYANYWRSSCLILDGHFSHTLNLDVVNLGRKHACPLLVFPLTPPTNFSHWMLGFWVLLALLFSWNWIVARKPFIQSCNYLPGWLVDEPSLLAIRNTW
jgi:hypothetical protein